MHTSLAEYFRFVPFRSVRASERQPLVVKFSFSLSSATSPFHAFSVFLVGYLTTLYQLRGYLASMSFYSRDAVIPGMTSPICDGDFMNVDRSTDWIWDWSSRPDQAPPKDWKFKHPKRKTYSIRHAKVGKNSLFSKEVLYTLFLTNFISLLLGTGVGVWLSRRGMYLPRINFE
ncbi:hypothetical protein ANN_00486 [Periplaneta americana]|uniref:Uncharacterized protein n=1 Tax=Periplaneta americana TaxID=6978 RepID=A0ABQ8TSJ7_PERAM|nr:hypothetical protein ANN_00486 [Periplaneta americana]